MFISVPSMVYGKQEKKKDLRSAGSIKFQPGSLNILPSLHRKSNRSGQGSLPGGNKSLSNELILGDTGISDLSTNIINCL